MEIFIFGSNGMLGNYIRSFLSQKYQVTGFTRDDYDLSKLKIESLSNLLPLKENDIVINCAGVIPQAAKDRDIDRRLCFQVNSIFPVILSMICKQKNAKFIHITTDCVFSGKDGNYNENSIHDETSDYGISKSLGELCCGTIIRTSIIGEEIYNKRSLLEWVRANTNQQINGYTNHHWNGVTCLQLAKIINQMIEKDIFWDGVKHIFSNKVTKYELISMINQIYELKITITQFETEKVDKTITSIGETLFVIPDLFTQIQEMKNYIL